MDAPENFTKNGLSTFEESQIFIASKESKMGKNISKKMKGKEAINFLRSLL
jgi:hypothetical protein